MIPLADHVQWHPILNHRKSAFLVAESAPKLNRAKIGGCFQVPMTLRATEREHIMIRHVCMVFPKNGRSAASYTWH